jgi:hypothetical protein
VNLTRSLLWLTSQQYMTRQDASLVLCCYLDSLTTCVLQPCVVRLALLCLLASCCVDHVAVPMDVPMAALCLLTAHSHV